MSMREGELASSLLPSSVSRQTLRRTLSDRPARPRWINAQLTRLTNTGWRPLGSNSCISSGVSPWASAMWLRISETSFSAPPESALRAGSMSD